MKSTLLQSFHFIESSHGLTDWLRRDPFIGLREQIDSSLCQQSASLPLRNQPSSASLYIFPLLLGLDVLDTCSDGFSQHLQVSEAK